VWEWGNGLGELGKGSCVYMICTAMAFLEENERGGGGASLYDIIYERRAAEWVQDMGTG